jgi:hypothetical protein
MSTDKVHETKEKVVSSTEQTKNDANKEAEELLHGSKTTSTEPSYTDQAKDKATSAKDSAAEGAKNAKEGAASATDKVLLGYIQCSY